MLLFVCFAKQAGACGDGHMDTHTAIRIKGAPTTPSRISNRPVKPAVVWCVGASSGFALGPGVQTALTDVATHKRQRILQPVTAGEHRALG